MPKDPVPEPDALEQTQPVMDEDPDDVDFDSPMKDNLGSDAVPSEVPEADALEQRRKVPDPEAADER